MNATEQIKYVTLRTLGELKAAIRTAKVVYVWVNWEGEDGDYIAITKASFLRGIGADTPAEYDAEGNPTGHGGKMDHTACRAELRGDEVYVD